MQRSLFFHGALCRAALIAALAAAAITPAPARADDDPTYRTATGLLNRGMHEAAAEEYLKFLKARPDDPRALTARYGLAVCLSKLARSAEAAAELDLVLKNKQFEFRADALLLRARCHLEAEELEPAARCLRELQEQHADSAPARAAAALEGETLYRAGRYAPARRALTAALASASDPAARLRCGYFLALTDAATDRLKDAADRLQALAADNPPGDWIARLALAEAQCRQRLGETRAAADLYRRAAGADDESIRPAAQLGLGQVLRRAGDADAAATALEPLLRGPARPETGPARLELARCWLDASRPEKAIELLSTDPIDGVNPDERMYWLARAESAAGKHADAADRLARAMKADPDSPLTANMLYDRAAALSRAGQPEAALRAFAQFGDRFADHELAPDAALAQASLLHAAGDYRRSAGLCAAIAELEASTDAARARLDTAQLLLAENCYLAGAYADADAAYSAFIRDHARTPQNATDSQDTRVWRASIRRGLSLARLDRPREARSALEDALKNAPPGAEPGLSAAAALALGDIAFAAEDWPASESWYRKSAPGPDADSAAALLRLGLSIHRQGRPAEAVAVYEQVIKLNGPETGPALHAAFERGQALAELGDLDAARASLESVLAAERDADERKFSPHAARQLASIASRQGRADDAARLLGGIAGDDGPDSAQAALDLASALLAAAKPAEAERTLRELIQRGGDEAAQSQARAQLGIALSRQSRYDESIKLLVAVPAETLDESLRPAFLYEKAWVLKSLDRADEAAEAYRQLLAAEPAASLEAHSALDLAQLEAAAQKFDAALPWLDRAEAAAARTPEAERAGLTASIAYLRGACFYRLERWPDAGRVLTAFIDADPDHELATSASLLAGEALLRSGKPTEAVTRLKQASSSADAAVRGPALLRLGEALAADDRWLESEETLLAYLSGFPDEELWYQARFGVGWAREQQGKHDAAIAAYREVAERHQGPTAARAQFQIGECLFALKRHDEAVKELLKVDILFAYPEWSAAALYEAGRCFEETRKPDDARKQFHAVVERFAESRWAQPARERLRALEPASLPGVAPASASTTAAPNSRRMSR